jgi:hypothetical protein
MKTFFVNNSVWLLMLFGIWGIGSVLFAQENCRVLKPEINGTYTGKCKKGLADGKGISLGTDKYDGQFKEGFPSGKGTYTWANGDVYVGEWKNGLRNGEGDLTYNIGEKDTTISGLWENDKYIGPKPKEPEVLSKTSIDRYNIYKQGDIKDRVLIEFLQNGTRNVGISNLLISSDRGTETNLGYQVGYENIVFPVTIRLSYTTYNKLGTQQIYAIFEFKIYERGDWRVEIHN